MVQPRPGGERWVFNAESAEDAENGEEGGKATANDMLCEPTAEAVGDVPRRLRFLS